MKISGTERALVGENIMLNITLLKNGISNLLISLSSSLRLVKTLNYALDKSLFSRKVITFEVSKLKFEKNLTLGLVSEKLNSEEDHASIEIKALDIEENVKEIFVSLDTAIKDSINAFKEVEEAEKKLILILKKEGMIE